MDFNKKLKEYLMNKKKGGLNQENLNRILTIPPKREMGDSALSCFTLGKNPVEEAKNLSSEINEEIKMGEVDFLSGTTPVGPYLNFFFNKTTFAKETLTAVKKLKEKYGRGKRKETIVIEYCGPNTNKPLHLGHVRNLALGNAMCRLLAFQGNAIHPVNIVNDRGIHICQSMLAYQKWGKNKQPDKKSDHFVGDYYVLFAKQAKENEDLKNEAQELLLKWERKDKEVRALWKKMNRWVLAGFAETYKRFGISFEKEYFESTYYEEGKKVVYEGLKKGVFQKDHAEAVIAPLTGHDLPDKVLLRGNETSLYITQDLYLAQIRYDDYQFDRMVYVVASEQQLHFKQLFAILEMLGKPYAKKMHHLSYGMVHLPTGRMKSREGTVIDADDIMDETAALAEKEIRARYPALKEKEIKKRAESIALGAIKFFMVKSDAIRDIIFNPAESLNFEGETGPYLQYTHARACSVLRKAGVLRGTIDYSLLKEPQENALLSLIETFPRVISEAATHSRLHILCRYVLDLAQAFNEFYHSCQVISEEKALMRARLALVDATRQVLVNSLGILGIDALEEM